MASLSRDGKAIMLCEGEQGNPGTWVWVGVSDIEPLFEQFRSKAVTFLEPPTNYPWAYEMKIQDPDGACSAIRVGTQRPRSGGVGAGVNLQAIDTRPSPPAISRAQKNRWAKLQRGCEDVGCPRTRDVPQKRYRVSAARVNFQSALRVPRPDPRIRPSVVQEAKWKSVK